MSGNNREHSQFERLCYLTIYAWCLRKSEVARLVHGGETFVTMILLENKNMYSISDFPLMNIYLGVLTYIQRDDKLSIGTTTVQYMQKY